MYMPHPFSDRQTLRIREEQPARTCSRKGIRAIAIEPANRLPGGPPVDERGIEALLGSLAQPERVQVLEIHYYSRLRRLPDLSRFGNLRYAHIAGGQVQDYDPLYGLRRLTNLFLVSYKKPSFQDFQPLKLNHFRAIRGRLERLQVRTQGAMLQSCAVLRDLSGSSIQGLTLEACNRVSFSSLTKVAGLRSLSLLACRGLKDFEWIGGCGSLERLTVTATPLSRIDCSAFTSAKALRQVFLAAPDSVAAEVSRRAHAVVSNGDRWYRRGKQGQGPDPLLS